MQPLANVMVRSTWTLKVNTRHTIYLQNLSANWVGSVDVVPFKWRNPL